jgi:hypothetical protein
MFVALMPAGTAETILLAVMPGFGIPELGMPGAGGSPVFPKGAFPGKLLEATIAGWVCAGSPFAGANPGAEGKPGLLNCGCCGGAV